MGEDFVERRVKNEKVLLAHPLGMGLLLKSFMDGWRSRVDSSLWKQRTGSFPSGVKLSWPETFLDGWTCHYDEPYDHPTSEGTITSLVRGLGASLGASRPPCPPPTPTHPHTRSRRRRRTSSSERAAATAASRSVRSARATRYSGRR